ncbi:MAG: hypothetical protein K8T25_11295 [Planctomycetia bacterium]|nr:hypothetical protein [Planctomycetia bacterium]
MMTSNYEEVDQYEVEDNTHEPRRSTLRFKPRKRPEYCKKRPPVRLGMALRNNFRTVR